MMKCLVIATLVIISAASRAVVPSIAQTISSTEQSITAKRSISGTVQYADTREPIANADVFVAAPVVQVSAETDILGRYTLEGLAPGEYTVCAYAKSGLPLGFKDVFLSSDRDLTSVDFIIQRPGNIAGIIQDENGTPLSGMGVYLIAYRYMCGALQRLQAGMAITGPEGKYTIRYVRPGQNYYVLTQKPLEMEMLRAVSTEPSDPRLRKQIPSPTYYGDSPSIEGALPVTVDSGEQREDVNIRVPKTTSYCVDGVLGIKGAAGAVHFEIMDLQEPFDLPGTEGMILRPANSITGPDGRIRVCDLHPGQYKITVMQEPHDTYSVPAFFGSTEFSITDNDVNNVSVLAQPRFSLSGEMVWDRPSPIESFKLQKFVELVLRPLTWPEDLWEAESPRLQARSPVPGNFSFKDILADDYAVLVQSLPPGVYIKDITFAGETVLNRTLHLGSASGDMRFRVTVADDCGVLAVRVLDNDGNPAPGSYVTVMPADSSPPALLAARMISSPADGRGLFNSGCLAPGKYNVIATTAPTEPTPESLGRILKARSSSNQIELNARAVLQIDSRLIDH
ncbi:MAG TPA: carboxypeptidase-like regulatory domain-containing protein [Terriglobia bacterium]|nr:carboxypeptidase-like regulatory domain-containing protein [Terriglobia bacterium]